MFLVRMNTLPYDIIGHVYTLYDKTIKICTAIIVKVEYKSNEQLRINDSTMKNNLICF